MWGYDIRNWQRHLNPLSWPEIMRQFALSAGFGPKLKKRKIEPRYPSDNNQVNHFFSIHHWQFQFCVFATYCFYEGKLTLSIYFLVIPFYVNMVYYSLLNQCRVKQINLVYKIVFGSG